MKTYTVYEAARQLGYTSHWIRVLLAESRMPEAIKADGKWQIPQSAIDRLAVQKSVRDL